MWPKLKKWGKLCCLVVLLVAISLPLAKDGAPWWTLLPWPFLGSVLQMLGTLCVAYVALKTLYMNQTQAQEHFEWRQNAEQFTDILNRFASENVTLKVNAAIRLAEMATWFRRTRTSATSAPIFPLEQTRQTAEPVFPFFEPAVSQLAAALQIEKESDVREEVVKGLKRIVERCHKEFESAFSMEVAQRLLRTVITEIADANRNAGKAFLEALARYEAMLGELKEVDLEELARLTRFCSNRQVAQLCLQAMVRSQEYDTACETHVLVLTDSSTGRRAKSKSALLKETLERAACLKDTRRALEAALHAVKVLEWIPPDPGQVLNWKYGWALDLTHCFLAGANLVHVQLPKANLSEAYLQGADLSRAWLQGAHLVSAHLEDTTCSETVFAGANLKGVFLDRALLYGADLRSARARDARMQDADLKDAKTEHFDYKDAIVTGTLLTS